MTPYCVISFPINFSKQSFGKTNYVCYEWKIDGKSIFLSSTVNSRYLKVEVNLRQLIFQSILSDKKSFALRYQQIKIQVEIKIINVSGVYLLIHESSFRYQCSKYE